MAPDYLMAPDYVMLGGYSHYVLITLSLLLSGHYGRFLVNIKQLGGRAGMFASAEKCCVQIICRQSAEVCADFPHLLL